MALKHTVVIGAGGMAREIAWLLRSRTSSGERYKFIGFVLTDLSRIGPYDTKEHIVGDYDWLASNASKIDAVAIGIGTPGVRLKVASEVKQILPHVEFPVLVHPDALFDRDSARL